MKFLKKCHQENVSKKVTKRPVIHALFQKGRKVAQGTNLYNVKQTAL